MSGKTSILKVTEHYEIELIADGDGRYKALCPFHNENTPSFKVFADANTWFSFCCNKGTTPYHLILELEKHREPDGARDRALKVLQDLSGEQPVNDPLERLDGQLGEKRKEATAHHLQTQHQLLSTFIRDWLTKQEGNYEELCRFCEEKFRLVDEMLAKEITSAEFKKFCQDIRDELNAHSTRKT